jgi:8-amino-3,8-dideoxy-alpha-D-manno-octulosonate transaminase
MGKVLAKSGGKAVRRKAWLDMWPGGSMYDEDEVNAAIRVLKAQSPFRHYGFDLQYQVDAFEKAMADYMGVKYALGVSSGSTALSVALSALGVGPGTEIILPALQWISDVNAVVQIRAIPVLCDINDTWNMDPDSLEKCITPRTGAIIVVHLAGSAADIEPICAMAKKHNIPVLEDCSQAAGTKIKGRSVGSFGDIATFSFQYNKNITTGEGGMVATNSEDLYRKCVSFHDVGFERDEDGISVPKNTPIESYGIGCRMDEIRGAVGLVQLKKVPTTCGKMRKHQQYIKNALSDIPEIKWRRLIDPDGDSGFCIGWSFTDKDLVKRFIESMNAEGIPVSTPPGGVHQYRYMTTFMSKKAVTTKGCPWTCPFNQESNMEYSPDMLPRSNDILDSSMMLTIPPLLTDEDAEDVITAFKKVASELF